MQTLAKWVFFSPRFDMRRWVRHIVLAATLLVAASHSRPAWAIDCARATSKIDRSICSTPELLKEDQFLNGAYSQAMKMLSPEGRSALRSDQLKWLRYRVKACGFDGAGNSVGNEHCLYSEIDRRNRVVWGMIVRQQVPSPLTMSPYMFTWRSRFGSIPNASGTKLLMSESDTPQIDRSSSFAKSDWPDAKKWNGLIIRLTGELGRSSICPDGNGDVFKESWIPRASARLIVVRVMRSDACHGRSYPPRHDTSYNMVMTPGHVHELTPADLFLPGNVWRKVFIERLQKVVNDVQSRRHCASCEWHPSESALQRIILNPRNWAFKGEGEGLEITLNQSMLPSFFTDPVKVRISSTDMQGILSTAGRNILNSPNLSSPAW